jgi:hypothetical protein
MINMVREHLSVKLRELSIVMRFIKFTVAVKVTEYITAESLELQVVEALMVFYLSQLNLYGQKIHLDILTTRHFFITL